MKRPVSQLIHALRCDACDQLHRDAADTLEAVWNEFNELYYRAGQQLADLETTTYRVEGPVDKT